MEIVIIVLAIISLGLGIAHMLLSLRVDALEQRVSKLEGNGTK